MRAAGRRSAAPGAALPLCSTRGRAALLAALPARAAAAPPLTHPPAAASVEVGVDTDDGAPHAPAKAAAAVSAPATATDAAATRYPWTKQWWPVQNVDYIDKAKPYPVTLLGQDYVVWWDAPAAKWRVQQDRCPHRLAPLSEGRVGADGSLACSYHGWKFNGEGRCTLIPQLGDPKAHASATSLKRACVKSFPTQVKGGLLFVWLESGPEAEAESTAKTIPMPPTVEASDTPFIMTEVPIDWPMWLEQGFDPSHGPFLHHGLAGLKMENNEPMEAQPLPKSAVRADRGFVWTHGAYDAKLHGMKGVRTFEPPNLFFTDYDKGGLGVAAIYGTPVKPGVTRVLGKFTFKKPPSGMFALLTKLPHWTYLDTKLQDQDTVMNARQEAMMRRAGLGRRDYYSPSRADVGVTAAADWFEKAGYEELWRSRLGPEGAKAAMAYPEPSMERMLNQWERHTKHCVICQKGMVTMAKWAAAAKGAAVAVGILAACLAAAARAVSLPSVVAAAAAVWLFRLSGQIMQRRYEKFINSINRWQRDGGLSLGGPAPGPIQI